MKPLRVFLDGPGLAGSTETLKRIGERSAPPQRYDFSRLEWKCNSDTTVFEVLGRYHKAYVYDLFDDADKNPNYRAQLDYLTSIDALIFVVDSQRQRVEAGLYQLEAVRRALERSGRDPASVPVVFQLNKRDIPGVLSEIELLQQFRWPNSTHVSTVATTGAGIEALIVAAATLAERFRSARL
jgi:hypothetical protein